VARRDVAFTRGPRNLQRGRRDHDAHARHDPCRRALSHLCRGYVLQRASRERAPAGRDAEVRYRQCRADGESGRAARHRGFPGRTPPRRRRGDRAGRTRRLCRAARGGTARGRRHPRPHRLVATLRPGDGGPYTLLRLGAGTKRRMRAMVQGSRLRGARRGQPGGRSGTHLGRAAAAAQGRDLGVRRLPPRIPRSGATRRGGRPRIPLCRVADPIAEAMSGTAPVIRSCSRHGVTRSARPAD
jgi:hypothetical protein